MLLPGAAKEAVLLKVMLSPGQMRIGFVGPCVATAMGRTQGW